MINVQRAYSIPPTMKPEIELQKQGLVQQINVDPANHFILILRNFCDAIITGKKPDYLPLLSQARAMEALRISARENRKVSLSEIN